MVRVEGDRITLLRLNSVSKANSAKKVYSFLKQTNKQTQVFTGQGPTSCKARPRDQHLIYPLLSQSPLGLYLPV